MYTNDYLMSEELIASLLEMVNKPEFMLGVIVTVILCVSFALMDTLFSGAKSKKTQSVPRRKLVLMDLDGTLFHWNEGADYLQPGYFENLKYFEPMRKLVDVLRQSEEYDFMFCTCYIHKAALDEKCRALKKLFSDITADEVIFVPYGDDKSDYIPYDVYDDVILIDDHTPNLVEAEAHGATGIKALNGVNHKGGTWKGATMDCTRPTLRDIVMSELAHCKTKVS